MDFFQHQDKARQNAERRGFVVAVSSRRDDTSIVGGNPRDPAPLRSTPTGSNNALVRPSAGFTCGYSRPASPWLGRGWKLNGLFERQDKARSNTKLSIFYFVLAVLCIIASVLVRSRRRESADGSLVRELVFAAT